MFMDKTEYPYMIITYLDEIYLLVAKKNIKRLSFDMNFLAVGVVTDLEGNSDNLAHRLNQLMKETPREVKESWFRRGYFVVNRSGIFIEFSEKHKKSVMHFFEQIPFFRTRDE